MTFRSWLVAVATVVVVLAVLAACAASYFAARNSLISSLDGTLRTTATSILSHGGRVTDNSVKGLGVQYTAPSGQVLSSGSNLPVTAKVKAVAANKAPSYFTEITLHGDDYREFVENAGTVNVTNEVGIILYTSPAALQVALPLDSVDHQLSHLGLILVIVAIVGIGLAFVLAWLVSRTARCRWTS